ncbi:MAG: hypothetical protein WCA77_08830 [Thermoplasmata archaeon]
MDPGQSPGRGVQCVIHWVDALIVKSSGPGSVCAGDGWSKELWNAFLSDSDILSGNSLAEKLRSFRDSRRQDDNPLVAEWRAAVRSGRLSPSTNLVDRGGGWIPVPATLWTGGGSTACIVSWDPKGQEFPSLSHAINSPEGRRHPPDPVGQARYYLECTLAKLHGVRFGPEDAIEDEGFAHSPEVRELESPLKNLEQDLIASPGRGRLDRFG